MYVSLYVCTLTLAFNSSARKLKKRFLTKEKDKDKDKDKDAANDKENEDKHGTMTAAMDEEHHQEQDQEEIDKDPYRRVLETSILDSTGASNAKSKLQLRWKSREEMGTTDDFSTILR